MTGRRAKRRTPSRDRLRRLLEEYDYLLRASDLLGIPVSTEGEILKDIFDQHPEYAGFLPGEEIEMENGTKMSPRMHLALEAIIEIQIAKDDPPEAREAYLKLLSLGVDPHEARHAVGRVFIGVVWLILQKRLTANPNRYYRSQLKALKRENLRHKVFTDYQ